MADRLSFVLGSWRVRLLSKRALTFRHGHLNLCASSTSSSNNEGLGYLEREIEAARLEKRPYRIDKSKLSGRERQLLRLRSRAIPLVADTDPLDIIYEDDVFLVVSKPSFVKMHPSHRFEGGSLLNRAIGHLGYQPYVLHRLDMVSFFFLFLLFLWKALTLHRLDCSHIDFSDPFPVKMQPGIFFMRNVWQHTTGVVVMAKKKEVCTDIMHQFRFGQVQKSYLCVVDGTHDFDVGMSFTVNAPIQRRDISFIREVGSSQPDSKPAFTEFSVLDKARESNVMLLKASPKTGRTHQIRVHAYHCGLPIIGDDLYNPKEYVYLQATLSVFDNCTRL